MYIWRDTFLFDLDSQNVYNGHGAKICSDFDLTWSAFLYRMDMVLAVVLNFGNFDFAYTPETYSAL